VRLSFESTRSNSALRVGDARSAWVATRLGCGCMHSCALASERAMGRWGKGGGEPESERERAMLCRHCCLHLGERLRAFRWRTPGCRYRRARAIRRGYALHARQLHAQRSAVCHRCKHGTLSPPQWAAVTRQADGLVAAVGRRRASAGFACTLTLRCFASKYRYSPWSSGRLYVGSGARASHDAEENVRLCRLTESRATAPAAKAGRLAHCGVRCRSRAR
jgi:hypothetical protein